MRSSCSKVLIERGVKAIVVACNTVSAVALDVMRVELDLPVLGVIEPGARAAAPRRGWRRHRRARHRGHHRFGRLPARGRGRSAPAPRSSGRPRRSSFRSSKKAGLTARCRGSRFAATSSRFGARRQRDRARLHALSVAPRGDRARSGGSRRAPGAHRRQRARDRRRRGSILEEPRFSLAEGQERGELELLVTDLPKTFRRRGQSLSRRSGAKGEAD